MNRALAAIITPLFVATSSAASAQTIYQENARDYACEWTDRKGNKDIDICHITEQGTNMGETFQTFHIGTRKHQYVVSDSGDASLTLNDKVLWKGKVRLQFQNTTETINLSDGMIIKMYHLN